MAAVPANHADEVSAPITPCKDHAWGDWRVVGYTGDWFHPHIVKRECTKCRCTETDER